MAQRKPFSGLRTYSRPLQNDLRKLERDLANIDARLASLIPGENIGSQNTGSGLVNHAFRHATRRGALYGQDPIDVYEFDWARAHIFQPRDDTIPITIRGNIVVDNTTDLLEIFDTPGNQALEINYARQHSINAAPQTAYLNIKGDGGAPFTPTDIAELEAWYDFNDSSTLTLSGIEIVTCTDKSGNGHTLTGTESGPSTTGPFRPQIRSDDPYFTTLGMNAALTIGDTLDGSDEITYFSVPSFTLEEFTFTCIIRHNEPDPSTYATPILIGEHHLQTGDVNYVTTWLASTTPTDLTEPTWRYRGGAAKNYGAELDVQVFYDQTLANNTPTTRRARWNILTVVVSKTSSTSFRCMRARVNGTEHLSTESGGSGTIQSGATSDFVIDVLLGPGIACGEFLLFDGELPLADITLVENYLADKWSMNNTYFSEAQETAGNALDPNDVRLGGVAVDMVAGFDSDDLRRVYIDGDGKFGLDIDPTIRLQVKDTVEQFRINNTDSIYASFTVASTTGNLTLSTAGGSTGNLVLSPLGDIVMTPTGDNVTIEGNTNAQLTLINNAAVDASFTVDSSGNLTIAADGDMTLTPTGNDFVLGVSNSTNKTITVQHTSGSGNGTITYTGSEWQFVPDISSASLDATLTALAAFNTNGLLVQTAADTFAGRTLQPPAAGITITNPAGTAGDPTFVLANDLLALEDLGSTGFAVRTGTDAWAQRTLTASTGVQVSDGNGVAANPAFSLNITGLTSTTVANGDEVAVYDVDAAAHRKVTALSIAQLAAVSGGAVPDTRQVIAGLGLIGGGALSSDVTLDVVSLNGGIVVNANDIELKLQTTSGLTIGASGLAVDDTIAGAGIGIASKVLSITSGNSAIVVDTDGVTLTLASTSGLNTTSGLALDDSVAGAGLDITSKVLRVVSTNTGITVGASDITLALASPSGLNVTSGLALDDSVAGTGLTITSKVLNVIGGTGITANANDVALNIVGLTTTTISSGDFIPFADVSDSNTPKKIAFSDFNATLSHSALSGYVADEHVPHTSVELTVAGTADQITSSAGAQDITTDRTWTLSIANNPILPGTGSVTVPDGTTAQTPGSPTNGMIRYDTDTDLFMAYQNGGWEQMINSGSGVVGGSNTQFQYNDAGNFNGAEVYWDSANVRMRLEDGSSSTSGVSTARDNILVTGTNTGMSFRGTTMGIGFINSLSGTEAAILGVSVSPSTTMSHYISGNETFRVSSSAITALNGADFTLGTTGCVFDFATSGKATSSVAAASGSCAFDFADTISRAADEMTFRVRNTTTSKEMMRILGTGETLFGYASSISGYSDVVVSFINSDTTAGRDFAAGMVGANLHSDTGVTQERLHGFVGIAGTTTATGMSTNFMCGVIGNASSSPDSSFSGKSAAGVVGRLVASTNTLVVLPFDKDDVGSSSFGTFSGSWDEAACLWADGGVIYNSGGPPFTAPTNAPTIAMGARLAIPSITDNEAWGFRVVGINTLGSPTYYGAPVAASVGAGYLSWPDFGSRRTHLHFEPGELDDITSANAFGDVIFHDGDDGSNAPDGLHQFIYDSASAAANLQRAYLLPQLDQLTAGGGTGAAPALSSQLPNGTAVSTPNWIKVKIDDGSDYGLLVWMPVWTV